MIIQIVIVVLAVSVLFYCLFGGADYGIGILELFLNKDRENRISDVIGPVWEANHVWLIIAVVILFMGFPEIYSTLTRYLHIPIIMMLLGIILRGTAFSFLHYDAIQDRSGIVYHRIFDVSSLLTPLFLGIIVGAMIFGEISTDPQSFYEAFIAPWFNVFCLSTGLFCMSLFTFIAAVFMVGEVEDRAVKSQYIRALKVSQITTLIFGGLVFLTGYWYGEPLTQKFFASPIAVSAAVFTVLAVPLIWTLIDRDRNWSPRLLAGGQVLCILLAWFYIQDPIVIRLADAPDLTFFNSAAPRATMIQLMIALLVGVVFILPALYFLMRTFKAKQFE